MGHLFFLYILNFSLWEGKIAKKQESRKNKDIRAQEVRLIDEDGTQLGIKPLQEALTLAQDRGLDLVEIGAQSTPPVCRIVDFSKYRYERIKKIKEARKKNKVVQLKEIRIRPKISLHDLDTKINYIKGFLKEKDKVKVAIVFQGREIEHQERGKEILQQLLSTVEDLAEVEKDSKLEGNRLIVMLNPKSK
ncbi:MAG: translation initiation factor IF-3 [bacterium]